ncbi:MAG: Bax inhibitor-1/YccA family protein [Acidimicrobiales bacterium]
MRTRNPTLNDEIFDREATRVATSLRQSGTYIPPAPDAVSQWPPPGITRPPAVGYEPMTVNGTMTAAGVLLAILLAAAIFGWTTVDPLPDGTGVEVPGWLLFAVFGGLGVAVLTVFKPAWARVTGPIYAVIEGLLVGAISHLYDIAFDGIVLQAIGLTIGVFALMLFLYASRIIKVTDKLRLGIVAATGAVFLVYMFDIVLRLFGAEVPFIHSNGVIGIIISLVIVGIAAMNLVLDFDFVERGVARRAPKHMEWYAAFGLLVTLIWLYLELLRLLGKLRSR